MELKLIAEGVRNGLPFRLLRDTDTESFTVVPLPKLSDEQHEVFDVTLDWVKSGSVTTFTFGGFAGTGKSTVTAHLAKRLSASGKRVAFCAYTGKAASVLRRKLFSAGVDPSYCGTIHGLIYSPEEDGRGGVAGWTLVPSVEADLIVVDEASMVDEQVYADLKSFKLPILAVGDHGQLPPINGSLNLVGNPMVVLEKIHRQAADNPILQLSQVIRDEGAIPRGILQVNDPRLRAVLGVKIPDVWLAHMFSDADVSWSSAVITYKNASRVGFNKIIYDRLGGPAKTQIIVLKNIAVGGMLFANGQRGIMRAIGAEDKRKRLPVAIHFPDMGMVLETMLFRPQMGMERTLDSFSFVAAIMGKEPDSWGEVGILADYGYAITGHKSQGDQWDNVIVVTEPTQADADTQARWLYTAVTRAAHNLRIVLHPRV